MPVFQPNKPIVTDEPVVRVENRLAVGRYVFQLVVVDDSGQESAPASMVVEVRLGIISPTIRPIPGTIITTEIPRPPLIRP
jgi:hypothetical protein